MSHYDDCREFEEQHAKKQQKLFIREQRYYVLKSADVVKYLTTEERKVLDLLMVKISVSRQVEGKDDLEAVVVEHDWPEHEVVWKMIEDRCKSEGENE